MVGLFYILLTEKEKHFIAFRAVALDRARVVGLFYILLTEKEKHFILFRAVALDRAHMAGLFYITTLIAFKTHLSYMWE